MALGNRLADMQPDLSTLLLYGLRKTLGMVVLSLAVLRFVWHRISPPPRPLVCRRHGKQSSRKRGMQILPALDVVVFQHKTLPQIAGVSGVWEKRGFLLHGILSKALFGLIILHILAALKREIDGDGTLTRMISGKR